MPYAFATPLNPLNLSVSTTTPSLSILASLLSPHSPLAPGRSIGDKVLPSLSSQYIESSPVTQTLAPINKPLKSSLRCSSSTGSFGNGKESSAPTQPDVRRNALASSSRKSVRFKDRDDGLESIHFFHATGRPSALLDPDSGTESDTGESSDASSPHSLDLANAAVPPLLKLTDISPIPSLYTPLHPYILLESISPFLAGARPPVLRGIIRVRNIAYEKRVAARFTIDDWTTVSEVLARCAGPAAGVYGDDGAWDRFAFSISLGSYAPRPRPPPPRTSFSHSYAHAFTLLLAVRFTVPGVGEWWDNNGGHDFRIVLAQASAGTVIPGLGPSPTTEEFPCRPQGVTCFADAQASMASLLNPYGPVPAMVTN
jgi:hypothetical protein